MIGSVKYDFSRDFSEVDTQYLLGPDSLRHCVMAGSVALVMAVPQPVRSANGSRSFDWGENHVVCVDRNPSLESLALFDSAMSGKFRLESENRLDFDKIWKSLERHKGNLMAVDELGRFRLAMTEFSDLPFSEVLSSYSRINRFVRTVIALNHDLILTLTFFAEREEDIMAFSVEYQNENILSGRGSSKDIATRTRIFLDSLESNA